MSSFFLADGLCAPLIATGYGFLFHMPGDGDVAVNPLGTGGMEWRADLALAFDFWVSGLPTKVTGGVTHPAASIYHQYADVTGHAPLLREDALYFWQSRNRYKSTKIALAVAERYARLRLPIGVLVIDYKNQVTDGDFSPNANCYPSVRALTDGVRSLINATTVFSFWPEAKEKSAEYALLEKDGW